MVLIILHEPDTKEFLMDIRFQAGGPDLWKGAVMLTFAHKGDDPATLCPEIESICPWFTIAPGRSDFSGKSGELALFHGHPKQAVPRVLAIGLGEKDNFSLNIFRKGVAAAVARCQELELESIILPMPTLSALPADALRLVEEAVCAAFLGLYKFDALRTEPKDEKNEKGKKSDKGKKASPKWLALGFTQKSVPDNEHAAARRGEHAAAGVMLARDLANSPPNIMTPTALAEAAEKMCKAEGMAFSKLDEKKLRKIGANTLLAVGEGSRQESCMVIMEYAPKGHEKDNPIVFVGKGLTFDSGGISIKPAANMHMMKSDMAGAAAVVGAMQAISQSNLERRVIGVLAVAENMPGGNAMRPGDVVKSLNGKTVEILNTDAEGRLVLCDALTYVQNEWTPAFVVDIATLTGACAVALGTDVAGLFSDDTKLVDEIISIGKVVGDNFWQLPLWPAYEDGLKSEVADIAHMGAREGGAISAALYLKSFVEKDVRWAHLDIAGTDWSFKKTPLTPVGAIGFGARTLLELARGNV